MTEDKPRGSTVEIMLVISVLVTALVVAGIVREPYVERNLGDWIETVGQRLGLL